MGSCRIVVRRAGFCWSSAGSATLRIDESRPASGCQQAAWVGELPGTHRLSLAVSLPLHHEVELDALLEQLYDPESPNFRQYLSVEEFDRLTERS